MLATVRDRRWSLLRRVRTVAASRAENTAATLAVSDHPPREAARITLPMLSGVADRLRWLCEQPSTDAALQDELRTTLGELEQVIQTVWSRAVAEPETLPVIAPEPAS